MRPLRTSTWIATAGMVALYATTAVAAKAPATTKTAYFALSGDAPSEAKKRILVALRAAIEGSGGVALGGDAPLDDSLMVLDCSIMEARCREKVAGVLGADEVVYGSLEVASSGPGVAEDPVPLRLALTLFDSTGTLRGSVDSLLAGIELPKAVAMVTALLEKKTAVMGDGETFGASTSSPRGDTVPAMEPSGEGTKKKSGGRMGGLAVATAAIGVAALATGVVLLATAQPLWREFEEGVDALPPPGGAELSDLIVLEELEGTRGRARTRDVAGFLALAVGGVALAAGLTLGAVGLAAAKTRKKRAAFRVDIAVAPRGGHAALTLRW